MDGLHRASIAKHLSIKEISCYIVDEIIEGINKGRNKSFPFYYEDMVGYGENVSTRTYTVMGSSQTEYALDSQHEITKLSNRAVYVYLNDVQLLLGHNCSGLQNYKLLKFEVTKLGVFHLMFLVEDARFVRVQV